MNQMTDVNYVSTLKTSMHLLFDSPQGKEVMRFLELTCCWYQPVFVPADPNMTLINDGRRQVLATIKSILELTPEQIAHMAESANT